MNCFDSFLNLKVSQYSLSFLKHVTRKKCTFLRNRSFFSKRGLNPDGGGTVNITFALALSLSLSRSLSWEHATNSAHRRRRFKWSGQICKRTVKEKKINCPCMQFAFHLFIVGEGGRAPPSACLSFMQLSRCQNARNFPLFFTW